MKKYLLIIASIFAMQSAVAQDESSASLDDIINQQSKVNEINYSDYHYRKIWGMCTFINLAYDNAKLTMTDPTGLQQNSKNAYGLTWGCSYNFHKRPIGGVAFIGLDYVWIDANYAQYEGVNFALKDGMYPYYNTKKAFDYGMSLGPQLTFFPFIPLRKNALDRLRIQGFFRVGYNAKISFADNLEGEHFYDKAAWGHGLYTEWGVNLDWNFIGIGYSHRADKGFKMKPIDGGFIGDATKFDQSMNRIYLQFRY